MMSIPTSNTAPAPTTSSAGAATGVETGGSVATAAAASATTPDAAGFMALIGSLLQGTTAAAAAPALPAGAASPTQTPALTPGLTPAAPVDATTVTAPAAAEADAETAALLASLGLTQALPSAVPPPPPASDAAPSSPTETAADAAETEIEKDGPAAAAIVAALFAAAAPSAPAAKAATPAVDASLDPAARSVPSGPATPLPAQVAAAPADAETKTAAKPQPLLAAAFAALNGDAESSTSEAVAVPEELASVSGSGDKPSSSTPSNGLTTLNTWAAAAHRISSAQDAAPRAAVANPEATLRESVGAPRWKDELGARITLMATQGQQSGSLRLTPEHLGPVEIQITVNDDKTTNVQFGAQHAETRTALQDALPRLREMFSSAGLQLGDAGVSGQAPRQRPAEEGAFASSGYESRGDGEPTPVARPVRSITHSGLLDTYA